MKKRTKLITTAIAMVLVISAMVVGIYAATSAAANISANVSWTATAGLDFNMIVYTDGSLEHFNQSPMGDSIEVATVDINTTTTNTAASGISKSFNLTFHDYHDDGVNEAYPIYIKLKVTNRSQNKKLNLTFNNASQSMDNILIRYSKTKISMIDFIFGSSEVERIIWSETPSNCIFEYNNTEGDIYPVIELTVKNPDVSISNFKFNLSLSFS